MNWQAFVFDGFTYLMILYAFSLISFYVCIGIFSVGETRNYIRKNSFTDYRMLASAVDAPSITVLAPAHNEGLTIIENVRSLLSLNYINIEVIVINDGSSDDSL